jgi:hypothetical protein
MIWARHDPGDVEMIALEKICLTDEYRFRVQICEKTVECYKDILRQYRTDCAKDESARYPFEPIYVLSENGTYHLIAGWHRYAAKDRVSRQDPRIQSGLYSASRPEIS